MMLPNRLLCATPTDSEIWLNKYTQTQFVSYRDDDDAERMRRALAQKNQTASKILQIHLPTRPHPKKETVSNTSSSSSSSSS